MNTREEGRGLRLRRREEGRFCEVERPGKREERQVLSLLRTAAEYEPEREVPVGLAARALAQRSPLCRRFRLPQFVFGVSAAALALGTLALLPILISGRHVLPKAPIPSAVVALKPSAPVSATKRDKIPRFRNAWIEPFDKPTHIVEALVVRPIRRHRPVQHRRHGLGTDLPQFAQSRPTTVPKVHWKEQTVDRHTYGVLTAAWVVHRDEEKGVLIASPAVLNLPLQSNEVAHPVEGTSSFVPDNRDNQDIRLEEKP